MILFDTSVLVAAMIQTHPHHESSRKAVASVREGRLRGAINQHSLAELFTTLTRYKLDPPIRPKAAQEMILENVVPHFKVIEMARKDYLSAIEKVCLLGFRGAVIYDALILQAALKKKARTLYTWNLGDFKRLDPEGIVVQEPEF